MSVHYRFKSALEYDTITFDALHISVKDLKTAIIQQKRIGKSTDFDLRITNAQTEEVYEDDNTLIPKNTSLLIARIPVTAPKQKQWEGYGGSDTPPSKVDENSTINKAADLTNLDAPEEDKIRAMMSQSTQDYDPSNYVKIRGSNQVGPVPVSYRCFKCHQSGHWIKDCPLGQGVEPLEIKKSTGIPHSFLVPVEGPQVPGAMMTSNGQYAVPALDLQAYTQKQASVAPLQESKPEIPDDLLCSICSDLLTDAVMIPCCGNSFCDECVRSILLESEDHECPDCHEKDISPATLIPNRFLRKSVANFKNTTGYEKKPVYKPKPNLAKEEKKTATPPPEVDSTENDAAKQEERTVISEADSTEYAKNNGEPVKDAEPDTPKTSEPEGPPGVSPRESPVHKITSKVSTGGRDRSGRERVHHVSKKSSPKHRRSRSPSPRKMRNRRSPSFERRPRSPETPTRDDFPPGMGGNYAVPPPHAMQNDVLPPGGMPPGAMQGPPPGMPHGFPTAGQPPYHVPPGAPPNFRLPPPGTQPPPYMPPGSGPYGARPVFDPLVGPPGFGSSYPGRPRDFPGRRGGRDRTPPGLIDDPLAAFNRILREKDEKRARQQRMARRSWSRSRSRSFSRSPPPLRRRSRSPRRRKSRSRSRSFSISRSRSHSYSPRPSPRGSPLPPSRRPSSPPQALRRGRYRSPIRSSPPRRRADRVEFERDYDRSNFRDKPSRGRRADSRERFYDERERDYGRSRGAAPPMGGQPPPPLWAPPRDPYYPEQPGSFSNRYPQQIHHIQTERKFEPPEVEQPPVPGLESELPPVEEFDKQRHTPPRQEREERDRDKKEQHHTRERRKEVKTPPPEKWRHTSPKNSGTPERGRKRRSPSPPKEDKKRDRDAKETRHRDQSDDERKSKSKDKKKHKEKKDDKKKKKEKKDKHHRSKERAKKEEFKQVIPKSGSHDEDPDEIRKKIEERRKLRGEEEKKRQEEERKKEERRLRFMEDERKKREEEARKEEAKRKAIEEARKLLEKDEEMRRLEKEKKDEELKRQQEQQEEEERKLEEEMRQQEEREIIEQEEMKLDLYDQVISEQEINKEVKVEETVQGEQLTEKEVEDGEVSDELLEQRKTTEDEDAGILELHPDLDIKLDESDILAPVPEKSRWEVDEDAQQHSPKDSKESNDPKLNKVSSEVLKRAENVIFARAINSIRPLEIKKVGGERVKVHAEEKPGEELKKVEVPVEKPRLSVKERLGKKVDDPDPKLILIEARRTPSPFNRRERRIEVERRHDKRDRSRDKDRRSRTDRSSDKNKRPHTKKDEREKSREKRKRTRSPSEEPRRRRKDKKIRKDKGKKYEEEHKSETSKQENKPKSVVEKRKSTLDEANFEPDYDLEMNDDESDKDGKRDKTEKERKATNQEESSSSDTSTSSSEEDKKKKKRKARKKKKRRDSSSSDSESSSESSDSDKDRKRKKHKKTKKKKKKSKHK